MEPIVTETSERDGVVFRLAIYPDESPTNPLEDWCEMGTILSLNRRHRDLDPAAIEAAMGDPDAVPLGYYEHGHCLWAVAGELPAGCRCRFDSVSFAGLWLPDALTLEAAARHGRRTRRHFLRERARQACDAYTKWCNGEIYGYVVERLSPCVVGFGREPLNLDSCWGFYGLEACLEGGRAVLFAAAGRAA